MDVPQLKLPAGLVRGLLEQHKMPIGHSQSLDLIAALPGPRNWPEVTVDQKVAIPPGARLPLMELKAI